MAETVEWLPDGTPRSPRFGDIYRSSSGGLEQARHVFLGGCGLPSAWAGQRQWRILETGFGLGMNFLATWRAWKDDPQRPRLLHFVSVEAWPVAAADIVRSAAAAGELRPLAQALADQWYGLLPGVHRLVFEKGRVLLTLHVRDVQEALRRQPFTVDSVFLDGFEPEVNAVMWNLNTLKAVARHCRRGACIATWTAAGAVRRDLAQCGFAVDKVDGLAPKRHALRGQFSPAWEPKARRPVVSADPGRCVIVGSGLAGAAVAASLARRGWEVTVLDAADVPAAGASGLPVGLLAPHFSPDDSLLSRLSRAGVRATLLEAQALLREGTDWCASGVLERFIDDSRVAPAADPAAGLAWSRRLGEDLNRLALADRDAPGCWHAKAGWIKPAALVRAWLAQPGICWRGQARVHRILRQEPGWVLVDAQGNTLAQADLVVVAAACASASLLGHQLPLQPVRGQVSWGREQAGQQLPPFPLNGNGHFIPHVPIGEGTAWFCGSSYSRGDSELACRPEEHQENLQRLRSLLPALAQQLAPAFAANEVSAWTGVRCASADRRPLMGQLEPGLWVSTAMGSRGLTFSMLCAELLAARLHDEPLPLESRLAQALDVAARQHGGATP
jgi:tRNA 5-methylaminomethyl-2-thiouridine biosynthesis bifunctional protein